MRIGSPVSQPVSPIPELLLLNQCLRVCCLHRLKRWGQNQLYEMRQVLLVLRCLVDCSQGVDPILPAFVDSKAFRCFCATTLQPSLAIRSSILSRWTRGFVSGMKRESSSLQ